jgi:hypothetical protein
VFFSSSKESIKKFILKTTTILPLLSEQICHKKKILKKCTLSFISLCSLSAVRESILQEAQNIHERGRESERVKKKMQMSLIYKKNINL